MYMVYNLVGQKFNRLTVIEKDGHMGKKVLWKCLCDCGNETHVSTNDLTSGNTKSCGCFNREQLSNSKSTHGMSGIPLYDIWCGIKQRCYYEKHVAYKRYGAKGIKMSEDWLNFENFYRDMHEGYKDGLTVDRKDNGGDYCKDNCRWATYKEQCNNRSSNRIETVRGFTGTVSELIKHFNAEDKGVYQRLYRGWGIEKALFEPKHK